MGLGMLLDYESLLAEYETGLFTKLRGFGPAAEFLETWVPDEDPVKSLLNMVEAAEMFGQSTLSVCVGPSTASSLDLKALEAMASRLGAVQIQKHDNGLVFAVTNIGGMAAFDAIGPAYRAAVVSAHERISHEGRVAGQADKELLEVAGDDGSTLMLLVEPSDHTIQAASHHGTPGPIERGLMEALCSEIEEMPIQEASDHGAIRLEFALRDKAVSRPVPGIVTPRNADPAFRSIELLLRRALALYRERTALSATGNEFDPGPSQDWREMPQRIRLTTLTTASGEICESQGLPAHTVKINRIEHDVRVVVTIGAALEPSAKSSFLMRFEEGVKEKVDGRLELYLEEVKDANVIRLRGDTKARTADA
jgi:hypothetical protein